MIGILDYGVGNVASIQNMFRYLDLEAEPFSEAGDVGKYDRFVLPGVGAFDGGIAALRASGLMPDVLEQVEGGTPLLGICMGMQMLADGSEEGEEPGLGLIRGTVRRFRVPQGERMRIPHMGWNQVMPVEGAKVFPPDEESPRFYFAHSFHFVPENEADIAGICDYGKPFVAAVERGNVFGVQFHPEKSHRFGMSVLRRFGAF
jgi:imidazole glycerol-phosphate synthase subunit HisH